MGFSSVVIGLCVLLCLISIQKIKGYTTIEGAGFSPALEIPDNGWPNNPLVLSINVGTEPGIIATQFSSIEISMQHSHVGDLIIAVENPAGITVVLMAQPGQPNPYSSGYNAQLSTDAQIYFYLGAPFDAESMGSWDNDSIVCEQDLRCDYYPDANVLESEFPSTLVEFNYSQIVGTWKLYFWDAVPGNTGSLGTAWVIFTANQSATQYAVSVSPIPSPSATPPPLHFLYPCTFPYTSADSILRNSLKAVVTQMKPNLKWIHFLGHEARDYACDPIHCATDIVGSTIKSATTPGSELYTMIGGFTVKEVLVYRNAALNAAQAVAMWTSNDGGSFQITTNKDVLGWGGSVCTAAGVSSFVAIAIVV